MKFHVASRGLAIKFSFPAGGGGSCLNCSNNMNKIFSRLLRSLHF